MASGQDYAALMKRWTPHNLLEALVRRYSFFWQKVKKDRSWGLGQTYDVPYEYGEFSSFEFGALTASAKITGNKSVLGSITKHPELWGSLKLKERDMDFDNLEQSFQKIMPRKLKRFAERHAEIVSLVMCRGSKICKMVPVVENGVDPVANDGVLYLKDAARFLEIGQRIFLDADDKTAFECYVQKIEVDKAKVGDEEKGDKVIVCSDITLAAVIDFSNAIYKVTEAQNGYATIPGAETAAQAFTSFKSILLSSDNGGDASIYGDTKTDYPFLQARNLRAASMDADNVKEVLLDRVFSLQKSSRGSNKKDILVSYKHFGNIVKSENVNTRYKVGEMKAVAGLAAVDVVGPLGKSMVVAVPEMEDEQIYMIDFASFIFAGSNFFEAKRKDGSTYFLERTAGADGGYTYITDVKFFGDLICRNPSHNGIIYGIDY